MSQYELCHHGVKGMHWGIRRYQNSDGTLTTAGKARYSKELQRNNQKKKKDRAEEDSLKDPSRWVKEDISRTKAAIDSGSNLARKIQETRKKPPAKKKFDLSNMSDAELRNRINRMQMEDQYSRMMNERTETVNKGRDYVDSILNGTGTVLGLASSTVGLALAIHQLKNG